MARPLIHVHQGADPPYGQLARQRSSSRDLSLPARRGAALWRCDLRRRATAVASGGRSAPTLQAQHNSREEGRKEKKRKGKERKEKKEKKKKKKKKKGGGAVVLLGGWRRRE
ncbi:hypothetical protein JCGZ_13632 [Jatropha curcas]|uniref:Uncharacterized protein n=1 Tax=Jatropha curcas TaxID=180498 RepID=A0A067K9X7_JATCU|nr:hypothetical protein JCGZ_13632 [Jatropha curcas]